MVVQTIPKDKYKAFEIGNTRVTGFKSMTYDYSKGHHKPEINNDRISLTIRTISDLESSFKFTIDGRDSLLKLKEVIEFALEEDNKNANKTE